ncbi:MAG: ScpA family protein [Patescibacteria group bacterium]|nr:ScpA family protein [Patescibacteria group bacterium]
MDQTIQNSKNNNRFLDVDNFVGPLDLLLELIEQNNLSINRIVLSQVADQYLEYVEKNRIGLEELVGFLGVASKLALIKSLNLLPLSDKTAKEKEEEVSDFEQRVIIYAKFRKATKKIEKLYLKNPFFCRQYIHRLDQNSDNLKNLAIDKNGLRVVFEGVLNKLPNFSTLREETVSSRIEISSVIQSIFESITKSKKTSFFKFSKNMNRAEITLTFLASLELAKRAKVRLQQKNFLGDILMLEA